MQWLHEEVPRTVVCWGRKIQNIWAMHMVLKRVLPPGLSSQQLDAMDLKDPKPSHTELLINFWTQRWDCSLSMFFPASLLFGMWRNHKFGTEALRAQVRTSLALLAMCLSSAMVLNRRGVGAGRHFKVTEKTNKYFKTATLSKHSSNVARTKDSALQKDFCFYTSCTYFMFIILLNFCLLFLDFLLCFPPGFFLLYWLAQIHPSCLLCIGHSSESALQILGPSAFPTIL